jgi:hypothetical protein
MPLDTNTDVQRITSVRDAEGNVDAPANEGQQEEMNAALGNQPGLSAFGYSTGSTSAEALPSNPVPDGVEVIVQADPSNTDPIKVGDAEEQVVTIKGSSGVSLAVENTDVIHVRALTAGDSVAVLFEEADT